MEGTTKEITVRGNGYNTIDVTLILKTSTNKNDLLFPTIDYFSNDIVTIKNSIFLNDLCTMYAVITK